MPAISPPPLPALQLGPVTGCTLHSGVTRPHFGGAPTLWEGVVWNSLVILPVQWTRGCSPIRGVQSHAVVFRGSECPSSFPLSLLSRVLLTCFTPHPQHVFALWCYQILLFILYFLHSSPRISHSPISPKICFLFFGEWYLQSKIWIQGVPDAAGVSLLPGHWFSGVIVCSLGYIW